MIKYGLTCISEILKDNKQSYQTMTRKRFLSLPRSQAIQILSERILHNVLFASVVIKHCHDNNISHYRIPEFFPLMTEPSLGLSFKELPHYRHIICGIKEIGATAKKYNITLSSHPSQFVVLGSKRQEVNTKSIQELNLVGWFFDLMDLPRSKQYPINIHPCGQFNSDSEAKQIVDTHYHNLMKCDKSVIDRFVIENCDKGNWNAHNLYRYFYEYCLNKHDYGFTLTFDNLHNSVNSSQNDYFDKFCSTWPPKVVPIMHWSEGGKNGNIRSHVDYITESVGKPFTDKVIWELEVKQKDKAILQLLKS